jgi:hypothetical protein
MAVKKRMDGLRVKKEGNNKRKGTAREAEGKRQGQEEWEWDGTGERRRGGEESFSRLLLRGGDRNGSGKRGWWRKGGEKECEGDGGKLMMGKVDNVNGREI